MKTSGKISSIDRAAEHALQARRRIERAVQDGRLPVWVLDTCEAWERAALAYGAAMARGEENAPPPPIMLMSSAVH